MRRFHVVAVAVAAMLATAGCAAEASPDGQPQPTGSRGEVSEPVFATFDIGEFDDSTQIDNVWMPLQPGTQWVYEGTTTEEGETSAHRIEFTVTDLVKKIEGVDAVVAWIVDYSDGEAVEKEIAFYAQDNHGNVWYLGEHPVEYADGEVVAAPTWIAGRADARAGVKMWAEPRVGTPSYFQGWAPAVEWTDFGSVDQIGQETCVPVDCYQDVLVIAESSLGEEGAVQLKYYARDNGEIRVGWRGDDTSTEELELVERNRLIATDLAQIRSAALELDAHAYEMSADVYADTGPAQ